MKEGQERQIEKGVGFGITTGIITTLGIMVGVNSATHSRLAVIAGVLSVAVADAFSDALGMHISEESELKHTVKEIWLATFYTFISKIILAVVFIVPFLFMQLRSAVNFGLMVGLFLLVSYNIRLAKKENKEIFKVLIEHLLIAIFVIIITHVLGTFAGHHIN